MPKVCPECGHEFQGNGWDGIDAHWGAHHEDIMPYKEAWPLIQSGDYLAKQPQQKLLDRISITPGVCGGKPCIRGTRIEIAIILDALSEGFTPEQIQDHYPSLAVEDIRAAVAYAAELARENVWKITAP
jgi:uncharacterized protein (DUF433 family)